MRTLSAILIPASILMLAPAASRACGKDTDCKGERVCEEGRCVAPSSAPTSTSAPRAEAPAPRPPAPPAAPAPAAPDLETMRRAIQLHAGVAARAATREKVLGGYVETAYLYKHSAFGDLEGTPAHSGVHLSAHRALTNKLHLGGYFGYTSIGEQHLLASGISLKAGSWIRDRAWLGLALNHGIEIVTGAYPFGLMQLSPRLQLDVLLVRSGPVAMVASLSAGPEFLVNGDGAGGTQTLLAGLAIGR